MKPRVPSASDFRYASAIVAEVKSDPFWKEEGILEVLTGLEALRLLWDGVEKASRLVSHEDLMMTLEYLKEDCARGRCPSPTFNFDLQVLSKLEQARGATGASHSQILEAYYLLFSIARENPDPSPDVADKLQNA